MAISFTIPIPTWLWVILLVWGFIWKGLGLWNSARGKQIYWFVAILILNTVGVLPIIYLLFFKPKPWIKTIKAKVRKNKEKKK